jgi:dihydroflavonol-4-reductase
MRGASLYAGMTTLIDPFNITRFSVTPEDRFRLEGNRSLMRLLVTGATGFLGRSVVRELGAHGHTLISYIRPSSDPEPISKYVTRITKGDITDPLAVARAADGADAIVHMAADLSHWSIRRERIFRTNVYGTRIVAEAAKTAGVPFLLHVSSVAAVGYSPDGTPVDERAVNNLIKLGLLYHESKRLAEDEAFDARRYGVKVATVNPGVIYGPRPLSHAFGHTMLDIASGRVPGHPTGGLSVVDVDDVAAGVAAAVVGARDGERYILAGENLRYAELFERQARHAGVRYKGRALAAPLLRAAAIFFETRSRFTGEEPRLTADNAKIAPLLMWYSSAKAERELGFRRRPFDETLERMVRAYRAAGLIGG